MLWQCHTTSVTPQIAISNMTRPLSSHTIIPNTNIRFLSLATFCTSTAKPPVTINALSGLFTKQTCSSPTSHPIGHKTQHKAQHRHICIYQVCKTTSRISIHACTTCSLKSVDYSTYCTHHTHHSYLAAPYVPYRSKCHARFYKQVGPHMAIISCLALRVYSCTKKTQVSRTPSKPNKL